MSKRRIINVVRALALFTLTFIMVSACKITVEVERGNWVDTTEGRKCLGVGNQCTKSAGIQAE